MMRKTALWAVFLAMAITPAAIATTTLSVEGAYVEARSAQVFIGGCVWNSEAVTIGREAIMAWRIEKGQIGAEAFHCCNSIPTHSCPNRACSMTQLRIMFDQRKLEGYPLANRGLGYECIALRL